MLFRSELSQSITSDAYSSFEAPTVYSLEFKAESGAKIRYCSTTFTGFEYQAKEAGTYRFAVNGSKAKVYFGNRYLEEIDIVSMDEGDDVYGILSVGTDGEYAWSVADDAEAKTGIYSAKNLLLNPGFEEVDTELTSVRYIPAYWSADDDAGFNSGNSRVNTGSDLNSNIKGAEGEGVAMWHGYGKETFFQRMSPGSLKANTSYHVQFTSWTHGDTKGTGSYSVRIGNDIDNGDIASHAWTQSGTSWAVNHINFIFKTGEIDADETLYFNIKRNSQSIAHFDRMTLVEFDESKADFGISGTGFSEVKFEEGKAYAPKIELNAGEQFEMTSMILNPDVDSNEGWQGTTSTNTGAHYTMLQYEEGTPEYIAASSNRYLDAYSSSILTFDSYQVIEDILDGSYTLECVARTNSDDFVIYAQGVKEFTMPITNNGNGSDEENQGYSELGKGWNKFSFEVIVNNGTLRIGTKGTATVNGSWCSSDEYRLYYNGEAGDYEVIQALKDKLQTLLDEVMSTDLGEMPDFIYDEIDDIYIESMKLINSTSATVESLNAAYDKLNGTLEYALEIQLPYNQLQAAIDELSKLNNDYVQVWVEDALDVLDSYDSRGEDFTQAKETLWKNVTAYYKGYESMDETAEIVNPGVDAESNSSEVEGWLITRTNGNTNTTTGNHWSVPEDATAEDISSIFEEEAANRYFDSWNGTAGALQYEASQLVEGIPPGFYILTAAARTDGSNVYLYANNCQTEVPNFGDKGNDLGRGWSFVEVPCVVGNDEVLNIGVKTGKGWNGKWLSADDFSLRYYPALVPTLGIGSNETENVAVYTVDGVIKVIGGEAKAVYNVSGVSLPVNGKLPVGIYYVIVNNKAYPVAVK